MSDVRWVAGLFALALVTWAGASELAAFDFSRYRPRMMKELIEEYKPQPGLAITRDIAIRAKVTYSVEFRDLPEDSRRLIAAWAEAFNVPGAPQAFRQELKVIEATREYWVPVQEVLVSAMKRELRHGEEIELFTIYIGQVDGRHIFLVNEFRHEAPH